MEYGGIQWRLVTMLGNVYVCNDCLRHELQAVVQWTREVQREDSFG